VRVKFSLQSDCATQYQGWTIDNVTFRQIVTTPQIRTALLPLEVLAEARPGHPAGILSGPNFAHEVAAGLPAAAVVAGLDAGLRAGAATLLGSPGFRLYGSDDPVGVQVGGAAKNVIAIAAGAVVGAGLGENARAALVTRGLGPHWSLGGKVIGQYSDFNNWDANVRVAPALEYNLFSYAEATRRQLTFLYAPGVSRFDYQLITRFNRLQETRPDHLLIVAANARQPWGSVNITATGTQFLDNLRQYNAQLRGQVNLRLGRGFSIDVGGSASRVRDQINIPRAGPTDDQILVRQRVLPTNYRYFANVGLSYTFGSIYNTVVNPRFQSFGSGGGGGFFFSF